MKNDDACAAADMKLSFLRLLFVLLQGGHTSGLTEGKVQGERKCDLRQPRPHGQALRRLDPAAPHMQPVCIRGRGKET